MGNSATKRTEGDTYSQLIGNGLASGRIIADHLDFEIDPQCTTLQIWNKLLVTLSKGGLDIVGSQKHDTYPQGFSASVLLLDGCVAVQYGIHSRRGVLDLIICTNGGAGLHEHLRGDLEAAFTDLLP